MKSFSRFIVLASCIFAAAPFLWHVVSSLKGAAEISRIPPTLIPVHPKFENYRDLVSRRPLLTYFKNSFVVASLASLLCVASASLAAHRLARSPLRVRSLVSSILLALAFLPPVAFLLPLYELVRFSGLINHPWGLILPYAALNLPLAIWLLTGYFMQIPVELE